MKEIFKVAFGLIIGALAFLGLAQGISTLTSHKSDDATIEEFNKDYEHFCMLMDHYNNHEYSNVEDLIEDHAAVTEQMHTDSVFASMSSYTLRQVAAVLFEGNDPLTPKNIVREYLENRKIYDVTSKVPTTGTPELESDDTPPIEEYESLDAQTEDKSPQDPKPVEQSSSPNSKPSKKV